MRFPAARRLRAPARVVAALLLGAPAGARAQALRIAAADSATHEPVPNALLTATNARGEPVANAATELGGPRLLALPGAGTYQVTLRRIGQRPYLAPSVTVGPHDTVALVLQVPRRPVALATVRVTARAGCARGGPGRDAEVAALWEQIRTAVTLVALQNESADPARSEIRRYATRLDGDGHTVLAHTVLPPREAPPRPFGTFSPDSLATHGYARHSEQADLYAIPDEAALLSGAFATDHCFDAVAGAGAEGGLVGLTFTPAPSRRVPDIAGVLWADSATAALRYLDFWYVDRDLPGIVSGPGLTGGEVHFATLPDGRWATVAWHLRTPRLVERAAASLPSAVTGRAFHWVRGTPGVQWQFVEVGAVASTAGGPSPGLPTPGAPTGSLALARLAERVRDGRARVRALDVAGRPLARASVHLTQQPDSAAAGFVLDVTGTHLIRDRLYAADTVVTTDNTGTVAIAVLPPGPYRVQVAHPALDSAGVEPPTASLVVVPATADSLAASATATVTPPALAALGQRCARGLASDTAPARLIYGTVTTTAGVPAAARVTASWRTATGGRSTRRVTTDDRGTFVVCGLPTDQPAEVGAESMRGGLVAHARTLAPGTWSASFLPIVVRAESEDRSPDAVALAAGPPPAVLAVMGTVVDSVIGGPLAGAVVQMVDAAHPASVVYTATADSAGAFRIPAVPPGRYLVDFDHPALDAYGITLHPGVADLAVGRHDAVLALAVPGPARVLASACPRGGDGAGLIIGRVRDADDGTFASGGRVRASWAGAKRAAEEYTLGSTIGGGGVFRLCGVPRGTRVTLVAELPDGRRSGSVDVVVAAGGVSARDLAVPRPR